MSYRIKSLSELPASVLRTRKEVSEAAKAAGYPQPAAQSILAKLLEVPDEEEDRNKYGNEPIVVNGIDFDSKWEAQRYGELLLMQRAGQIRDLKVHESYGLHVVNPAGHHIRVCGVEWDFVFWRGERMFVEDAKSAVTRRHPVYCLKQKMFEAEYGVSVVAVERNKPRPGHLW